MFNIKIGEGIFLFGNLRNVNWGDDPQFIRIEIDPGGGENYIDFGISQLFSVPYALFAAEAGNAQQGGNSDPQRIDFNGTILSIENGNSVDLGSLQDGINDADADPGNELQSLILAGNQLSISDGNSVTLPTGGGGDNQTLSLDGHSLAISDGNEVDLSAISPWQESGNSILYDGPNIRFINSDLSSALLINKLQSGSGFLSVLVDNQEKIIMSTTQEDGGFFRTNGSNGNLNVLLSTTSSSSNNGWISTYNSDGENRASMSVSSSGRGGAVVRGPNGNVNVNLTAQGPNLDHGFITVNDNNGESQAGIYVDANGKGRVFADFVDTFVENPDKVKDPIRYSMIQGPESAAYLRGTGKLTNGVGSISFPKHFSGIVDKKGLTVMITPLSAESKGIAVIKKERSGFRVKELLNGSGN